MCVRERERERETGRETGSQADRKKKILKQKQNLPTKHQLTKTKPVARGELACGDE